MGESERLSTAAIAIAVIAFLVTFGQFLQQMLGTAEGFRRCKREVIGSWMTLTRRRFLWYEFRFETLFTAPELALFSPAVDIPAGTPEHADLLRRARKLGLMQSIVRNPDLLADLEDLERTQDRKYHPTVYDFLAIIWHWRSYWTPASGLEVLRGQGRHHHNPVRELRIQEATSVVDASVCPVTNAPAHTCSHQGQRMEQSSLEKGPNPKHELCTECSRAGPNTNDNSASSDEDATASWLPLLRALHKDHIEQWRGECKCAAADEPSKAIDAAEERERSMAMLFLRKRSWDFMPLDVVKPVASAQMRALIVLAARLGMSWSGLDLMSEGGLSAQGNSYYLSSITIRGLGTTVQFGSDGHAPKNQGIIPTTAADKLLFGILPGEPGLCPEVRVIGDDRKQSLIDGFFRLLRVSDDIQDELISSDLRPREHEAFKQNLHLRICINDALILFCPFLPKPRAGCTSYHCYFHAWVGQKQMSTFQPWVTRRCLLVQLRGRMAERNIFPEAETDTTGVFEPEAGAPETYVMVWVEMALRTLESRYCSDFYGHPDKTGSELLSFDPDQAGADKRESQRRMLQDLQSIFETTTTYFTELQEKLTSEKANVPLGGKLDPHYDSVAEAEEFGPTFYVDLVGANVELSYKAGQTARSRWEKASPKHKPDFSFFRPRGGRLELYEAVACRVEFREKLFRNLRGKRGWNMTDDDMEDAWWMLMLRGTAWRLSVNCKLSGQPIPSSLYDNQQPVWMM